MTGLELCRFDSCTRIVSAISPAFGGIPCVVVSLARSVGGGLLAGSFDTELRCRTTTCLQKAKQ